METGGMLGRFGDAVGDALWWLYRYGNRRGACRVVYSGGAFSAVPDGVPLDDDATVVMDVESVDDILGPWWVEALRAATDDGVREWLRDQAFDWSRDHGAEVLCDALA